MVNSHFELTYCFFSHCVAAEKQGLVSLSPTREENKRYSTRELFNRLLEVCGCPQRCIPARLILKDVEVKWQKFGKTPNPFIIALKINSVHAQGLPV